MAKLFAVFTAIFAVCASSTIREKRETFYGGNCGQSNHPVPDPNDCSYFFDCFNGNGVRKACARGLEFNPSNLQCDYPLNIPGPLCGRRVTIVTRDPPPCQGYVRHWEYCNAFVECNPAYRQNDGCPFFCTFGQYFDDVSNRCVSTKNVDTDLVCAGRQMASPALQELLQWMRSCVSTPPPDFIIKSIPTIPPQEPTDMNRC